MATSTTAEDRAAACVVGSLVADAAAHPIHWVYNEEKMEEALKDTADTPEFRSERACPFYSAENGSFSCYGDQGLVLLRSLVECKGLNLLSYMKSMVKAFGPGSAYELPNPSKKEDMPKPKGLWANTNVRKSLDNMAKGVIPAGIDEAEADSVAKIAPVVALYYGTGHQDEMIEKVVRATQNNDKAVQCAVSLGRLLERLIITGNSLSETIPEWLDSLPDSFTYVKEAIELVMETKELPHQQAARRYGVACALPGNFQGTVHALLTCCDYVAGVRATMRAGGGNCSRCCCVGAGFAAQAGLSSIPQEWVAMTTEGKTVVDLATKLVALKTTAN